MATSNTFGERLRILRRTRGWSQERLAEELGVSSQAVSQWERGVTEPDKTNLLRLPELLSGNPLYLLYGLGLPNQGESATIRPSHIGGEGPRVAKVSASAAAQDVGQAITESTDTVPGINGSPSTTTEFAIEVWDDRNSPHLDPGSYLHFVQGLKPRPGDYVFVGLGPTREPTIGMLAVQYDESGTERMWLEYGNPRWGRRPLSDDLDQIVAVWRAHVRVRPTT